MSSLWLKLLPLGLLDSAHAADGWKPDLQSKDVQAVVAASVAINVLVLAIPFYINRVYTSILPQQSGDSLLVVTGMLFAVVLLDLLLKILRAWVVTLLSASQEHRHRLSAIRHYLAAPLNIARSQTIDQRLEQVRAAGLLKNRFMQQWIFQRIDLPFVGLYLLVMLIIGGWLFLVPILTACLFYPQAIRASQEALAVIRERYDKQESRDDVLLSALSGTETVKGLGIEGFLVRRLEPVQESLAMIEYQQQVINARLQHVGQLYAQVTGLLVVTLGSILVVHHSLGVGALAACTLLSRQVSRPFSRYFSLAPRLALLDYGVNKLNQLVLLEPEPGFYQGLTQWPQASIQIGPLRLMPGESKAVYEDDPRQLSVFIAELLGHQECSLQPLTVGDLDIASLRLSERRKCIRCVSAKSSLYNGTLLDNLTSFRADSHRLEAIQICKKIGIHDALIALPRGYSTLVGEQAEFPIGNNLSFRVAVAAALLDHPALLLVDASSYTIDTAAFQWIKDLPLPVPRLIVLKLFPYTFEQSIELADLRLLRQGAVA